MSWRDYLREGVSELTALRLFDYASRGPELARLDCNKLPIPPTTEEVEAFIGTLRGLALQRYPDVSGRPLREALAKRWQVEPDEILLGNGSVEILSLLMTAFSAPRRGPAKLLYPEPSFPYYEVVARTHGVTPISVPLDAHFQLDEARLARTIDEQRPAVSLFASPNNPTGNRFDSAVLARLARRADSVFVVDEAYADFDSHTMLANWRDIPGLFVLRSLSKIGFAGLRLGALVASRDVIAELDKVRLPWNVNAVSMSIACAALAHPALLDARIQSVLGLRRQLETALHAIPGLIVYPSAANFVLVRVPTDARVAARHLLKADVLVKDVSAPGLLDRCLRITVGTVAENGRCACALRECLASAA